jgi:hypothetical protein
MRAAAVAPPPRSARCAVRMRAAVLQHPVSLLCRPSTLNPVCSSQHLPTHSPPPPLRRRSGDEAERAFPAAFPSAMLAPLRHHSGAEVVRGLSPAAPSRNSSLSRLSPAALLFPADISSAYRLLVLGNGLQGNGRHSNSLHQPFSARVPPRYHFRRARPLSAPLTAHSFFPLEPIKARLRSSAGPTPRCVQRMV